MSLQQKTTCFYCKKISSYESDYPSREGGFTTDETALRCALHSQFKCLYCKKFHHFSWLYWCQNKRQLTCGDCNPPILKPLKFWSTTYTYSFHCSLCEENHYDLYYAEYQGTHPWQNRMKRYAKAIIKETSNKEGWTPNQPRGGKKISLEEALRIPNSTLDLREPFTTTKFHSVLIDQEQLKQSDVQDQWEETSNQWIELIDKTTQEDKGDLNRQLIIDPAMWEIIGDVKELAVLDAGCGNGYFSRILAQKGAIVSGVDQSRVFIDFCKKREKEEALGIKYHVQSLEDLVIFENDSFDLIVSNIVFVDVLDYKTAFKEMGRILKSSGRFVWSNLHPIFGRVSNLFYRIPSDTPRNEERLYVMIDRYFDSGGTLISWGTLKPIWQFDRTLSEYVTALKEAGFVIRDIVEPKPSIDVIKKHPRNLAFDTDRIPFFIIYECVKFAD
ncbi:MAG: class I SAM-dependent methyltransferase [Candidatus Thorarchaeota archaeon]